MFSSARNNKQIMICVWSLFLTAQGDTFVQTPIPSLGPWLMYVCFWLMAKSRLDVLFVCEAKMTQLPLLGVSLCLGTHTHTPKKSQKGKPVTSVAIFVGCPKNAPMTTGVSSLLPFGTHRILSRKPTCAMDPLERASDDHCKGFLAMTCNSNFDYGTGRDVFQEARSEKP